ncbi:MAG: hypothetical protein NZT61_07880, partial [Deltaproteobacteria bacterium]|nr:hypothetical protein [Deltaproteobacteria bacterium]
CPRYPCIDEPTIVVEPYECKGKDYSRELYLLHFISENYIYRLGMQRTQWICNHVIQSGLLNKSKLKNVKKELRSLKATAPKIYEATRRHLLKISIYPIVECQEPNPYCSKVYNDGYDEYMKEVKKLVNRMRKTYTLCFNAVPFWYFEKKGLAAREAATFLIFKTMRLVEKSVTSIHKTLPREIYKCDIPSP